MIFYPFFIHEGKTTFVEKIPAHLQHLAIKDFKSRFVSGPWGSYLSQWYETPDFVFWIHYFFVNEGEKLHPTSEKAIFTHHHLIKGFISGEINGGMPVQLSELLSHFFYLPKGIKQTCYFGKGDAISVHVDWKKSFLQKHASQYPSIAHILEVAETFPDEVAFTPPAYHSKLDNRVWLTLIETLHTSTNPQLLLDAKAREFLLAFCESIEHQADTIIRTSKYKIHASDIEAAYKVRLILEEDLSSHIPLSTLATKVNINECTLKRVFKLVYKTSIYQYLVAARLQFAYEKIVTTEESIRNIAFLCGYTKASHFSKLFKKKFDIEPRELRSRKK